MATKQELARLHDLLLEAADVARLLGDLDWFWRLASLAGEDYVWVGGVENVGIDYGRGVTNVDSETGIHYGVISAPEVPGWYEESEPVYRERVEVRCPACEDAQDYRADDETCVFCGHEMIDEIEQAFEELDPIGFRVDGHGVYATQNSDDNDIFIIKSPYFTFAQFCSPCAPGAVHLSNYLSPRAMNLDNRGYCFGHEWFENGHAPYPVFDVKTGHRVYVES